MAAETKDSIVYSKHVHDDLGNHTHINIHLWRDADDLWTQGFVVYAYFGSKEEADKFRVEFLKQHESDLEHMFVQRPVVKK